MPAIEDPSLSSGNATPVASSGGAAAASLLGDTTAAAPAPAAAGDDLVDLLGGLDAAAAAVGRVSSSGATPPSSLAGGAAAAAAAGGSPASAGAPSPGLQVVRVLELAGQPDMLGLKLGAFDKFFVDTIKETRYPDTGGGAACWGARPCGGQLRGAKPTLSAATRIMLWTVVCGLFTGCSYRV